MHQLREKKKNKEVKKEYMSTFPRTLIMDYRTVREINEAEEIMMTKMMINGEINEQG